MGQTIGSQIFGSWYDVIGWVAGAALFFYLAVTVENMPPHQKERFPPFLLNKNICVVIALFMALLGVGKVLKWW
ncbi:MAG: hypothetical protein LBS40_00170 [Burkholderiales bacterium]|jgi:hypothetical protein|nr:hypothetical protein [Burkholderiales bacterium]